MVASPFFTNADPSDCPCAFTTLTTPSVAGFPAASLTFAVNVTPRWPAACVSSVCVTTCACARPARLARPTINDRPASLPMPCRNNCKFILRILCSLSRNAADALTRAVAAKFPLYLLSPKCSTRMLYHRGLPLFSREAVPMTTQLSQRSQLQHITAQLDELKARGTHFRLRVLDDVQAPVCTYDGKRVINLASNNYLGLTAHPKLREAAIQAIKDYGVGSGAVRTIAGTMKIHM